MTSASPQTASVGGPARPSPRLQAVLDRFEEIGSLIHEEGEGWSCDGGAGVLSLLCDQAGLAHELCIGLYWWPEEKRAEKYALMEGVELDPSDPEDAAILDSDFQDEHHHWVEAEGLILDPNGEIRGEPRWQPTLETDRYESFRLGEWKAWDKVLSWSPYAYSEELGEGLHTPAEAASWLRDVERALEHIESWTPSPRP